MINKLTTLLHRREPGSQCKAERLILLLMFGTAMCVTVLRFFTETDLGYDLTLQIQAAQNLLSGHGLKVFYETAGVGTALELRTLTHWPCGYSLYAASVLSLGLPLALVTKVFGATFTLLGWWGWSRFALTCLGTSFVKDRYWLWVACFLGIMFPLFLTPEWKGTDIFLWAALPWVFSWLSAAAAATERRQLALYALVGFACGLCMVMRYAGVVLVGYAGLLIALQTGFRIRDLAKRYFVFLAAVAPTVILQFYYIFIASEVRAAPGGIDGGGGVAAMGQHFIAGALLLPALNYPLFCWMPDRVLRLIVDSESGVIWPYLCTTAIFCLPFIVARKAGNSSFKAAFQDLRVVAACFVVMVPVFLWVCMVFGSYSYVGDRRYYEPLIPIVLLLVLYLATPSPLNKAPFLRWVRYASSLFYSGFAGMMVVGLIFLFIPTAHGNVQRRKLMGESDLRTFPGFGLSNTSSAMRRYVVERLRSESDLHLLTNFESLFYADPAVDRSRVHRMQDARAGQKIRGPYKLLIAALDVDDDSRSLYSLDFSHGGTGALVRADCLASLPDLKLVQTFQEVFYPGFKVKILESFTPSNITVRLGEDTHQ